jgi:hypothetical protein
MNSQPPSPVLSRIAFYRSRRDEVPNQELARELAEIRDAAGIQEIAAHLWDKNQNVQSDCLKVLYEIGHLAPDLIAGYVHEFLKLLESKNNRMVWGGMIGLGTIASLRAAEIWPHTDEIIRAVESGSLITTVWGVKTLAKVAAAGPQQRRKIFPFLLQQVKTCIPRDVPLHAESMLCAVDDTIRAEFLAVLNTRQGEMSPSQLSRLKKVLKAVR